MIVPMKKSAVITQSKDAAYAVEKLRSLGILHVEHCKAPKGTDIGLIEEDIALINKTIDILNEAAPEKDTKNGKPKEIKDWKITSRHIVDLWSRLDQIGE
ncbi:MAG: hypothetical protein PHI59_06945, partial [Candidatus Omnitrophica bacterium]|nr:hypothetical protein [Candidatus Omnitrophota bacterium]